MKKIEYLDLALTQKTSKLIMKENFEIKCNLSLQHINHCLNGNNEYNTLIDIIINLSENLKESQNRITSLIKNIEKLLEIKNNRINLINGNLEYVKNQNNMLLEKCKDNIKQNASNEKLIRIIQEIENMYKTIKEIKFLLE